MRHLALLRDQRVAVFDLWTIASFFPPPHAARYRGGSPRGVGVHADGAAAPDPKSGRPARARQTSETEDCNRAVPSVGALIGCHRAPEQEARSIVAPAGLKDDPRVNKA